MSSTAAGSRITVYFPAGISRGRAESTAFCAAISASAQRIEIRHIRRIRLLPAGRIRRQHGDRNFRRGLRVPVAQSARIEDPFNRFRAGKNSRGRELVLLRHSNNLLDALGAQFGSNRGSRIKMPRRQCPMWRGRPSPALPAASANPASAKDRHQDAAPSPDSPPTPPPAANSHRQTYW